MAKHDALVAGPTIDDGVVNFGALGVDDAANFGGVPIESHGIGVIPDSIQHYLGMYDTGIYISIAGFLMLAAMWIITLI